MTINIGKLYTEGQRKAGLAHCKAEEAKIGILRAGNAGLVEYERGKIVVAGKCLRASLLRAMGYYSFTETDSELMFEGGRTSEDSWATNIASSWGGTIKREEEVPINWHTISGRPVSGRPDLVLCDKGGTPIHGIELKLVCSLWTARDVLQGRPKLAHVIQAAHYMWRLGVPFDLWYVSRVKYAVVGWAAKHFPQEGTHLACYMEYGKDGPKSTKPFITGYQLENIGGTISVTQVNEEGNRLSGPTQTIVTIQGIENYYNELDKLTSAAILFEQGKGHPPSLPPPPRTLDVTGNTENYKSCDYCDLADVCGKCKDDIEIFLRNIPSPYIRLEEKAGEKI